MSSEASTARILEYEKNLRHCPMLYEAARQTGVEPGGANELLSVECDYVISPALHGYVLWVLRQALSHGIKRLYFLARDGYLMYRAAEKFREGLGLPVECRYLYCSRYAVRIPMFHMDTEEALEYICRGGIDVTLTKVLNRAGLLEQEQERICGELKSTSFGQKLIGEQKEDSEAVNFGGITIPYAMLEKLRDALRDNVYFMECMERHSEEALPALEGYFQQEGMTDDIPMAVVDSGWTGSMQKVMNRLLKSLGKQAHLLSGYYWGLYELPADVDPGEYHCYYFTPDTHIREKVYFSNNLFEEIYSAPHGITLGYERQGEKFVPVTQEADETHRAFIDEIAERVGMYTDRMLEILRRNVESSDKLPACENDREVILAQFSLFMGDPTSEEAELFGRLSFSDDVLEYGGQLAAAMTEEELAENHAARKIRSLLGTSDEPLTESAWYEASAVINGHRVRRHIRGYKRYKYLLYRNKARTYRKQRKIGD